MGVALLDAEEADELLAHGDYVVGHRVEGEAEDVVVVPLVRVRVRVRVRG